MASPTTSRTRILAYLKTGKILTSAGASAQFGISPDGFRARITELRKAGFPIYSNNGNGTTRSYRIGTPTRREMVAARIILNDPYYRTVFANQIEANLAIVK